ncbi:MAG: nucleotide pyrophosphohydrolase [Bacteroidota bacterium]|nr:nucleotide pyrophosphohydrolase [Bacteroidota bacterium]
MQVYQKLVDDWIKKFGVRYFNELTNTVILMEEVGELARHISRTYGEQSYKKVTDETTHGENIKDEMGDILFVLFCLANQMGIDMKDALHKSIQKKSERDMDRHVNNPKLKN